MELAAGTALWLITMLLLVFAAFNLVSHERWRRKRSKSTIETLAEVRHA
jgi:thiamine transport system permease protein